MKNQPLAYRIRPQVVDDIIGQTHLLNEGKIISDCLKNHKIFSMIFYGNPGCGKTTLATCIANTLNIPYRLFNAVTGNKKQLDEIFELSKYHDGIILIIDEVHRLNKDKQDLLLPYLEDGSIILIGCTTSNPLHAINPAIRSRTHLIEIKPLNDDELKAAILRALNHPNGLKNVEINDKALNKIINASNHDVRFALNLLELCALEHSYIDEEVVDNYATYKNTYMDSDGDAHYNIVSAFQKSIRGSDVNAALYYLAKLIMAKDMDSIERRLLVTAYEDIGLGNPNAVMRTFIAIETAKRVGFPEARIPLANAVIDLCLSPKSKSSELAIDAALNSNHNLKIPDYLNLSPVNLDDDETYDYSALDVVDKIQYLPDAIKNAKFYHPSLNGKYEQALATNLAKLEKNYRTNDLKTLKKKR